MIVCCGEALIDMLPRTTGNGEPAFSPYPGGAIFNTAIALGRLGVETGIFTGISSDLFGAMLLKALASSCVDARHVQRSDRPSTLAFVQLVDGQATYAFHDENTAGRMLSEPDIPQFEDSVAALHFGGISLMSEPCGSTYEALMVRERGRRVTMLDPNIRPDFVTEPARYRARIRRMVAMADIVKVSDEDLAWLAGDGTADDHARRWLDLGPKLVIVTRGKDGAVGFSGDGFVAVPASPVHVVDTVGAGDTFNAGVLASLWRGGMLTKDGLASLDEETVHEALVLGARAAAVTVSRAGANPPWSSELD